MHRLVLSVLIIGMSSTPSVGQVQSGSTGGSIGKTEKSISGGEIAADPQRTLPARKPSRVGQPFVCNRTWQRPL